MLSDNGTGRFAQVLQDRSGGERPDVPLPVRLFRSGGISPVFDGPITGKKYY